MQPGNRTGTPNYMAPEVVRRRPTSQRLDVFAFGVTAYELCAFELPWPRGAGLAAMAHGSMEPTEIRKYCPQDRPAVGKGDLGLPRVVTRQSPGYDGRVSEDDQRRGARERGLKFARLIEPCRGPCTRRVHCTRIVLL